MCRCVQGAAAGIVSGLSREARLAGKDLEPRLPKQGALNLTAAVKGLAKGRLGLVELAAECVLVHCFAREDEDEFVCHFATKVEMAHGDAGLEIGRGECSQPAAEFLGAAGHDCQPVGKMRSTRIRRIAKIGRAYRGIARQMLLVAPRQLSKGLLAFCRETQQMDRALWTIGPDRFFWRFFDQDMRIRAAEAE